MRIVRDYHYTGEADKGASVAIGNFDGVHIGHRAVIDLARSEATRLGAPSCPSSRIRESFSPLTPRPFA